MAKNDMNINNIMLAKQAIHALPDEAFQPLMNDDTITAIINQIFVPISTRNTHLNADDTKRLFGINSLEHIEELKKLSAREVSESVIVFYKARYDITPERNKGALRKATQCFGMGDNAEGFINEVCNQAGITRIPNGGIGGEGNPEPSSETTVSERSVSSVTAPSEPKPKKVKTEQQKDAEQDAGRKAVEAHQSRKKKSVKESKQEQPASNRIVPEPAEEQPADTGIDTGIPSDTDISVSCISPECFWDYRSACEIVTAEPEPYIIEGMFRKGTINIIGATQNAGKTTVLFDIMGAVASGSNFLTKPDKTGGFKTHQGSCILLDFEGDKIDTASRLRATLDTYSEVSGIEPSDIPVLVRYMPIDWTGSDDKFPEKIYKAITALPAPYNTPAIIAFDTYSAFSDVENENESTQAQKVFNRFKELKTLFHDDVTIFVTMHLRKLNDKNFRDVSMDDLRGTSAAAAAGSDIWFLSEVKGEPTTKKLKQVKAKGRSRSEEIKTLSLAYESNINDGTYSRVRFFMIEGTDEAEAQAKQTERKQKNEAKREKDILAFIATHPQCSVNRICKGDREGNDRLEMNIKTCTPVVLRLIDEGKIYNLSENENSYSLVINPKYKEDQND